MFRAFYRDAALAYITTIRAMRVEGMPIDASTLDDLRYVLRRRHCRY